MRHASRIVLALAAVAAAAGASLAQEAAPAAPRTSRIEGTASLDRHRKVVGASVLARAGAERSPFWLTSTDEKGLFVLDRLPEGKYRVEVRRDGLVPAVKEGIEVRFPYRAIVEVMLAPEPAGRASVPRSSPSGESRARITGVVGARGAGPIAEARIRAVRSDAGADPRTTLTLSDGSFALEDLPAGVWRVEVLGAGFLPVRAELDLADEANLQAVLVAQPANYVAPALDILPQEQAIPPPGWGQPTRSPS